MHVRIGLFDVVPLVRRLLQCVDNKASIIYFCSPALCEGCDMREAVRDSETQHELPNEYLCSAAVKSLGATGLQERA
eukprot:301514-Amphidinium_carterae.1